MVDRLLRVSLRLACSPPPVATESRPPFQQRADETSSLQRASSDATPVCEPHCAYDVASLQIDCSSSLPAIHRSGLAARSSSRPSVLSQFVCLFCLRGLALAWLWDSEPLRVMDIRWTLSDWNLGSSVRYSRSTYWAEKGAVASRRPRKRAKTAARLQGCLQAQTPLAVRLSEFSSPSGRLRIDCLETTCSYCRSRGKKTAESQESRSLMDPSPQQQIALRIVLRDSAAIACREAQSSQNHGSGLRPLPVDALGTAVGRAR